jgi:calcineurin-like phosphoesterase family protein
MYFFTADQHYGHNNIIRYCNRPFNTVEEMDDEIIKRHNSVVNNDDTVINVGDFCWCKTYREAKEKYISKLNGNHFFLVGDHDSWFTNAGAENWGKPSIWKKNMDDIYVVACHYAMRVWPRSHFNSIQLYGHTHGRLEPVGKQWDVGVDNNDFYPVSFDSIKDIMSRRPNNPNFIPEEKR